MKRLGMVLMVLFLFAGVAFAQEDTGEELGEYKHMMYPGDVLSNAIINAKGYKNGIVMSPEPGIRTIYRVRVFGAKHNGIIAYGKGVIVNISNSNIHDNRKNGLFLADKAHAEINSSSFMRNGAKVTGCIDNHPEGWMIDEQGNKVNFDANRCNHGIDSRGGATIHLNNSKLAHNGVAGIWISGEGTTLQSTSNEFFHNAIGAFLANGSVGLFDSDTFYNNRTEGNTGTKDSGTGIYSNNSGTKLTCVNCKISHQDHGIFHSAQPADPTNTDTFLDVRGGEFFHNKKAIEVFYGFGFCVCGFVCVVLCELF